VSVEVYKALRFAQNNVPDEQNNWIQKGGVQLEMYMPSLRKRGKGKS